MKTQPEGLKQHSPGQRPGVRECPNYPTMLIEMVQQKIPARTEVENLHTRLAEEKKTSPVGE